MPSRFRRKFKRRRKRKMPIVKLIKKVIQNQAEHKYNDQAGTQVSLVEPNPFLVNLANIGEGTSNNNRIGNNIKVASIRIRYNLQLLNSSSAYSVRVYVYQSLSDGTPQDLPNVTELWPPLEVSKINYRILYDRTHQMSLGVNENLYRDIRIKGKRIIDISFDGTSGGTNKGQIFIHFETDNVTADELSVGLFSRLYFTDL